MKQFLHKNFVWLSIVVFAVLTLFDQWTKGLAVTYLKGKEPFTVWEGVFELYYFENTGAAWGILKGQQIFFYILTLILFAVFSFELYRLRKNERFVPLNFTFVMLLAGAAGNFIDRITQQYVVDFLYFKLINFPIFNVADCYITVSVAIIALLLMFFYNDEEFDYILPFMLGKEKDEQ